MAIKYGLQKRYKDAIYYDALATLNSCFFKENCRRQIATLWKTHGPFDYSELYNSAAKIKDHESFVSREAIAEIIKSSLIS